MISGLISGERIPHPDDPAAAVIYDAVLVARRGLGADELRLAGPAFLDAVRWSVFAEKLSEPLPDLQAAAAREPDGLTGQHLVDAIAGRKAARELVADLRETLLLSDEPEALDG